MEEASTRGVAPLASSRALIDERFALETVDDVEALDAYRIAARGVPTRHALIRLVDVRGSTARTVPPARPRAGRGRPVTCPFQAGVAQVLASRPVHLAATA
jgi:hypothetical protein